MGKIAKVQEVTLSKLKPYENNAKIHGAGQIEKLKASIEEFGFLTPCLIDEEYNLIAGHGRVMAAKELGMETVPCVFVEGLTEAQRRAYILADNRLGELGEWDMDLVFSELEELKDMDFDIELTGFDLPDETEQIKITEDEMPDEVETRAKVGDLWKLGGHRLICGDSTDVAVIDRLMDGVKADMVFTDPPYNIQTEGGCKGSIGKSLKKQGKDIEFIADFNPSDFLNVLPIVFNGNMNAYIFCNKELLPDYLNWCKDSGYSWNVLIWKKPTAIPIGDSHRPDIEYLLLFRKNALWNNGTDANYSKCLQYDRVKKSEENGNHPTLKPIELIANELKISSNKNSIVVDFFGGSGSTMMACEQLNRKCYMCELDPHYCDVIIQRWENFTGQKAELVEKP